jgi:hypothetical protein
VNYQEMCREWNDVVVAEMKEIQEISGDVEVDKLFERLRLKTTCQLSAYANVLTDRYQGVNALKPYLAEYKRLCHELKEANADDLASPKVDCRAPTPKPTHRLVKARVALPLPSSFGASESVRRVRIKSAALCPRSPCQGDIDGAAQRVPSNLGKRAAGSNRTPPSHRGHKDARIQQDWKLEICSQCFIRHQTKEIVYVEHPDGQSVSLHGGRQSGGKTHLCPRFASKLTLAESRKWATDLQGIKRRGELRDLYEQFVESSA